jgi:hypothetical protein
VRPPLNGSIVSRREKVATQKEIDAAFYRGECLSPLTFTLNDDVSIVTGPAQGKDGVVVSIVATEPDVVLLVELNDGSGDIHVPQSALAHSKDE